MTMTTGGFYQEYALSWHDGESFSRSRWRETLPTSLQRVEFFHGQRSLANQFTKESRTQFIMLRNGERVFVSGFHQHHMRTSLSRDCPPGSFKFSHGV